MSTVDQRRQRGRRNRAALLAAALDLFSTSGFDGTTVEQIAGAAGVSERTFFHHFPTKEDVLFDGYAERLQEVTRTFRTSPGNDTLWDGLTAVARAVADSIAEAPEVHLQRSRLYDQAPSLRARMLRINEEWIDGMTEETARRLGVDPHTDVRPRLVATLLNGANRAALEVWVASDGRADLHAVMAESLALLAPTVAGIEATLSTTARHAS